MNIFNKYPATTQALRNRKASLYILIAITIATTTGMYSCKSNESSSAQVVKTGLSTDSLVQANNNIQQQYNAARMQADQLTSRNAALDSAIRLKDAEIAKLTREASKLGKNNKALSAKLKKDQEFIASLKDQLSDKAKYYAEKLGLLQSDRDNLASAKDSLMRQYLALKELGSVLHASNFRMEPIHLKHHGRKEKRTAKARKVDDLRIYFDIDENRIAEDGTKKLYLSITDPNGQLLRNNSNTSGSITTSKGATVNYSVLKEINLKQDEPVKDVTVDWKQDDEYKKGTYTIVIYNGGYKVGGGSVALR